MPKRRQEKKPSRLVHWRPFAAVQDVLAGNLPIDQIPKEMNMQVREVMTNTVRTVHPETRLAEIARVMRDEDIGSVPVAENDRLVGMVTDRDLVVRGMADGDTFDQKRARDVMSPRVLYCMENQSIEDVLDNMGEQQVRRLPVVDVDKRLVGFVSIGDLTEAANPAKAGESLKGISGKDRR
jgi:CBS domain-containing protein